MYTASHIVTLSRSGKKPLRKTTRVLCDDDRDAVFTACQWVVWSQERGKRSGLPRWDGWAVQRIDGATLIEVRRGVLEDATKEYTEENVSTPTFGTASTLDIVIPKGRRNAAVRTRSGDRRSTSRLAQFAADILKGR